MGGIVSAGLVRKDNSDRSERLFPSSLGREGGMFLSLNPSGWGAKRIINKD